MVKKTINLACKYAKFDVVKYLFDRVDLNADNNRNNKPSYYALKRGNIRIIGLFVNIVFGELVIKL